MDLIESDKYNIIYKFKYHVFIFIGLIIASIIGGTIWTGYLKKRTAEPIIIADKFMNLIVSKKFNDAVKMMVSNTNLENIFSRDGEVSYFKNCGFDAYSDSKVTLIYYLIGRPAEKRNAYFQMERIDSKWMIKSIQITYFIDREIKNLALLYLNFMTKCNFEKARLLIDVNCNNEQKIIESFFLINKFSRRWEINSANISFHKYYSLTTICFISPDKKQIIKIKVKSNNSLIYSLKLKQNI